MSDISILTNFQKKNLIPNIRIVIFNQNLIESITATILKRNKMELNKFSACKKYSSFYILVYYQTLKIIEWIKYKMHSTYIYLQVNCVHQFCHLMILLEF